MTDTTDDENWPIDLDDLEDGAGGGAESRSVNAMSGGSNTGTSMLSLALTLLPLSVVGLYAFVDKAVVLAAVESIIGAGGLSLAITHAFWIVGAITVITLSIALVTVALLFLATLVFRSKIGAVLTSFGILYFGGGALAAGYLFPAMPLLVGFVLTTNLILGGTAMALKGISIAIDSIKLAAEDI